MARCPAGRLAAVAAHRAGVGWDVNVGRYRSIHRLLEIYSRLSNVYWPSILDVPQWLQASIPDL